MDKDEELRILQAFLTARGMSAEGLVPHERPDFLIPGETHPIGVEVTTLMEASGRQATVPQQWASEARRVLRAVRRHFESKNTAPVVVHMEFQPSYDVTQFRDSSLPSELARLVGHHLRARRSGDRFALGPLQRDPHPALAMLYAAPLSGGSSDWRLGGAYDVHPATCDDVRNTVAAKEPLVADYRNAADEVWLLINCDLLGQGVSLVTPEEPCVVASSFDAVYCIDFYSQWVSVTVTAG
jgi:hypothetical protein